MKICLVNNLFPPINTGTAYYTYNLALNLVKRGHKVIVITNSVNGKKYFEIEEGIRIYRLPAIKLPRLKLWMGFSNFSFTLTPKNIKKINSILVKEEVQIIHQCNTIFDLVFASSYFAHKLNLPLFAIVTTMIQHPDKFYNRILEIFDKTIIKYLFSKNVHTYIAWDKETLRYIKDRYDFKGDIRIITCPLSFDRGKNSKPNYKKTYYNMVSIGHISKFKDREEFIKAWSIVVKKFPQAKLKIVGANFSDDTRNLIKKLKLEDNIIFTGEVQHDDVLKFVENVDFGGMLMSHVPYGKCVGVANLEIMGEGIPVIIDADDDFFGDKFPFKSGEHFVKVESRDPRWLAGKFIQLFEENELREKIGKSGEKFTEEILTWDKIIDELEVAYNAALNNVID